jgi:hypothetical protein
LIGRLLTLPERRPGLVIALIGCLFAVAYASSLVLRPKPDGRVVTGDALHHYVQLRSIVFDQDVHFRNEYIRLYNLKGDELGTEWVYAGTETGHVRNLMPVGPALLWMPLFALVSLGVWVANLFGAGYPFDGYGRLFQATAGLSGIAAATLGTWFTYLAASRLFASRPAIWGTLTIWLASPTIYYSVISPTYSHAASLLAAGAFWLVWLVTRTGPTRYAALGVLTGIAALMRWQDVILLVPSAVDLVQAWRRGDARPPQLVAWGLLTAVCAAVTFVPQMLVWIEVYGRPLAMPQGEGFMRWTEPALVEVLFSDFHGLFTWTPVVLLAAAGMIPLWKRAPALTAAAVSFLLLSWYVNAAVADWWAGEAFGSRRFVSCVPIFGLGLAALADRWTTSLRRTATVAVVIVAHTFLLLVQYQAFMHGLRDVAPYPRGVYNLYLARFVVPIDLVDKWLE